MGSASASLDEQLDEQDAQDALSPTLHHMLCSGESWMLDQMPTVSWTATVSRVWVLKRLLTLLEYEQVYPQWFDQSDHPSNFDSYLEALGVSPTMEDTMGELGKSSAAWTGADGYMPPYHLTDEYKELQCTLHLKTTRQVLSLIDHRAMRANVTKTIASRELLAHKATKIDYMNARIQASPILVSPTVFANDAGLLHTSSAKKRTITVDNVVLTTRPRTRKLKGGFYVIPNPDIPSDFEHDAPTRTPPPRRNGSAGSGGEEQPKATKASKVAMASWV
jgi:hypothetical protein